MAEVDGLVKNVCLFDADSLMIRVMDTVSDDDVRREYVESMGAELGTAVHDLQNQVALLLRKWDEFEAIFEEDEERIELLNRIASNFFYFLQIRFYEDAVLHIARLTDLATTGRSQQANLTVQMLPSLIDDADLRARIQTSIDVAIGRSKNARLWRNKQLAHIDRDVLRKGSASAMPPVSRTHVSHAIDALCEPIRILNAHFGHQNLLTSFRDPFGSRPLLYHLKVADRELRRTTSAMNETTVDAGIKAPTSQSWTEMDPANAAVGWIPAAGGILDAITSITLHESVPDDIRRDFAIAKGTMSYGYLFYPLWSVAAGRLRELPRAAIRRRCDQAGTSRTQTMDADIALLEQRGLSADALEWARVGIFRVAQATDEVVPPTYALDLLRVVADGVNRLFETNEPLT